MNDDKLEFVPGSLFGDWDGRYKAIMGKIIYAKTLDWQHEGTSPMHPAQQGEEPWKAMPYHPDEAPILSWRGDDEDR